MSNNIQIIREWIQNETKFFGRTDESFIAPYVDICNDDVEKTKQRIVRYYELRRLYPGLMTNRDFLHEKHVNMFRQKVAYSDVKENYELPVVITIKLSRLERSDSIGDLLHFLIFTFESAILDSSRFRKHGGIAIFDFEDIKFTHALQVTPTIIMQTLKCIFEGVPLKCNAILFINVGSMLRAAISLGSLFLPTEIRNIITFSSGTWESIHDKVPPECLPIEYGGTNGTLGENAESCEGVLMRWRDYLLDDERYGFNDTEQIEEESY